MPAFDIEDVSLCLERGITIMKDTISFLLHIRFFAHILGTGLHDGGPVFLAICLLPPFVRHFMSSDFWTKGTMHHLNQNFSFADRFALWVLAYLVNATNKHYIRKSALERFTWNGYKQEVMAGGINNFLSSGTCLVFAVRPRLT